MSDEVPLVSVGIPTYNRPEGLRRTLECITGQTYQNLEIIVSDNCSPGPETERVVREFMEKDSRIQYFKQEENKGPTFNFRFVLEKATGEYFMWAADDDQWPKNYIDELFINLSKNCNVSLSVPNVIYIDYQGNISSKFFIDPSMNFLDVREKIVKIMFIHKSAWVYGLFRTYSIKDNFKIVGQYTEIAGDRLLLFYYLFNSKIYLTDRTAHITTMHHPNFLGYRPKTLLKYWTWGIKFYMGVIVLLFKSHLPFFDKLLIMPPLTKYCKNLIMK